MTVTSRLIVCTAFPLAICLSACTGGKEREGVAQEDDSQSTFSPEIPPMTVDEEIALSEPLQPTNEVLAFDDFFFLFLRSKTFQLKHVRFPVQIEELDGTRRTITSGNAFTEYFYWPNEEEYTLLLTDVAEMEGFKSDLALDTVVAQVIDLEEMTMRCYDFAERDSVWWLHASRDLELQGRMADFLKFYAQFTTDTIFQGQRLAEQIHFTYADPDSEKEVVEGILLPSQWEAFRPELPQGTLTNFDFGQPIEDSQRIVVLECETASSMMRTFTFEQWHGRWILTSFDE